MSPSTPRKQPFAGVRPFIQYLFAASLIANLAGLAALVNVVNGRGGLSYLKAYFQHDPNANIDIAGVARAKMFAALPTPDERPIVFLGDSITAHCEWRELFGDRLMILNRGIGGDTSAGVLDRIPDVSRLHPGTVFLMIGTNDGQLLGLTPADTLRNYRAIIEAILRSAPDTVIYAESILPSRAPKFNKWSDEVNRGIRQLADGKSVSFVDLRPSFSDANQLLDQRYTYDGLHLNAEGYLNWKRQIDPIIERLVKDSN